MAVDAVIDEIVGGAVDGDEEGGPASPPPPPPPPPPPGVREGMEGERGEGGTNERLLMPRNAGEEEAVVPEAIPIEEDGPVTLTMGMC